MITNKNGSVNLQSALNHLVNMGVQDPNILMEYAQKPPSWLGSNAGLLVNMAANMVGDQRQRAQASQAQQQPQKPTVMEQGIAKLAPQQPQMMAQAPQMPPQEMPPQMMAQAPQMPQAPVQMAQGGLAELDIGDMYSENSFATGGIVAFDEGGDVGMNVDRLPSLNVNTGKQSAGGQGGEEYALKNLMSALLGKQTALGGYQLGMEGLLNAFPSKNSNIDYSSLMMPMTPGTNTTPDMLRQALGFAGEMYERNPNATVGGFSNPNQVLKYAEGGEVQHYDGTNGSYVEGVDYPDYTVEEEPTSPFSRFVDYLDISKSIPKLIKNTEFGQRYEKRKALDEEIQKTIPTLIGGERGMFDKETKAQQKEYETKRKALQEKRKEYPYFAPTTPTTTSTADEAEKKKALANIEAQKKALDGKGTSQNALKKANDDYLNALRQTNADQISSYDQAMQKVMDLAKNDPYRKQLRDEYEKEKSGAFYDVLGDIGASLVGAKKGQEGQALQQGLTAATSRVKDLRKQKRDLMLAEQKADRDYQMLGAKYGFDSEQARSALAAKERMAEAESKKDIQVANITSGSKSGMLDLNAKKAASKDFLSWQEKNLATVMMANRPLSGDKKRDTETAAAQRKLVEMQNYFTNYYGGNSGTSVNQGSVLQFDSSGKLISNEEQ